MLSPFQSWCYFVDGSIDDAIEKDPYDRTRFRKVMPLTVRGRYIQDYTLCWPLFKYHQQITVRLGMRTLQALLH